VTTEEQKDYLLTFEDRSGYLYAYIKGERDTLSIAKQYWMEIANKTLSTGHKKLLVVEDIPEEITIAEVHQLVSELSELPVKDVRVAFVDRYVQHKSLNDFGILVGENRGLTLRSFDSAEQAEPWLMETA
jgi:cytidylate kinase